MNLNERERRIVVIGAIVLGLIGIYYFLVSPYLDKSSALAASTMDLRGQKNDAETLFRKQRKLKVVWTGMQAEGLKIDTSEAEKQTRGALLDWAHGAGVQVSNVKFERTSQEGSFQVIGFSVSATGSMPQVSRLLWAIETSTLPMRVNDAQITPQKEGTDLLQLRVSVSALCQPPIAPTKTAGADNTGAKS